MGEIWFAPPEMLPQILAKYIFTDERLSVQCHPSDAQTLASGMGRQGKDECWLVLGADPGASIGLGFREPIDADGIASAAVDGSIEELLEWYPVQAGDFFYIPANTVHAIGAGITLIEVQQNSDITYRLYDYGRPRELHIDAGARVALGAPHPPALRRRVAKQGCETLVEGPHFRLDRLEGAPSNSVKARYAGPLLVIPVDGECGVGGRNITPGQCALASSIAELSPTDGGLYLIAQPI